MGRVVYVISLIGSVFLVSCARPPRDNGSLHNPDVITADEILATHLPTAFEVIERLRPQFLRTRGPTSALRDTRIIVFQDNLNLGGVEMLRQIRAADVREIRFLNSSDATTRFGSGFPAGVISVTSRGR